MRRALSNSQARAAASIVVAGVLLLVELGATMGQCGCASSSGESPERSLVQSEGLSRTVRGDWNDVEAAAVVGLERAECAILRRTENSPTEVAYALRTVLDQDGVLRFTRAAPAEGAGSQDRGENIDITVFCRVGPFGDQEREERILDAVRDRLGELRGVEFAPSR